MNTPQVGKSGERRMVKLYDGILNKSISIYSFHFRKRKAHVKCRRKGEELTLEKLIKL